MLLQATKDFFLKIILPFSFQQFIPNQTSTSNTGPSGRSTPPSSTRRDCPGTATPTGKRTAGPCSTCRPTGGRRRTSRRRPPSSRLKRDRKTGMTGNRESRTTSRGKTATTRSQSYKTFYGRNLRTFVIS